MCLLIKLQFIFQYFVTLRICVLRISVRYVKHLKNPRDKVNHARLLDDCPGSYKSRKLIQSVICCILLAMLLMRKIRLTIWVFSHWANGNIHTYNKATDPFESRGAMALYRMMCWAPTSISIGSSLYSKKGNKDVRSQEVQSYYVGPLVLYQISDHLNILRHNYHQYEDRQEKRTKISVIISLSKSFIGNSSRNCYLKNHLMTQFYNQ